MGRGAWFLSHAQARVAAGRQEIDRMVVRCATDSAEEGRLERVADWLVDDRLAVVREWLEK